MASAAEHNRDERAALSERLDAIVEQLMALERELQQVARELAHESLSPTERRRQ